MSKTYFISDLHFGHSKIIEYEGRKYKSVYQMDKDLIRKWNNRVNKKDTVWVLGDFSMRCNKEYLEGIISQLNGHKRLIKGNHDRRDNKFYMDAGFEYVSRHPIILENHFILSHEPEPFMKEFEEQNIDKFFFIYGHVHFIRKGYDTIGKFSRCVCACRQGLVPIEIEEYNKYIKDNKN